MKIAGREITDVINEGMSLYLTVTFLTSSGSEIEPDYAKYRVDDFLSDTEIIGWCDVPASGIFISGDLNLIISELNPAEVRVVTVIGTTVSGTITSEYNYAINNLEYL